MACHSAQVASAASANAASSKASKRKDNRPSSSFACGDQAMCTRLSHVANICGRRALSLHDPNTCSTHHRRVVVQLVTVGKALCLMGMHPAEGQEDAVQRTTEVSQEKMHCTPCRSKKKKTPTGTSPLSPRSVSALSLLSVLPQLQALCHCDEALRLRSIHSCTPTTRGSQQGSASTPSLSSSSVSPLFHCQHARSGF